MTFNVTYGYKLENGIVKIDEAESGIVSMIYELYTNSRMNQAKIAKHLNEQNIKTRNGKEWYYSLIHQILKNERYTGKLDYPQIVSKEMFNIAKKMMSQNNTNFIYRAPNHEINVSKPAGTQK